MCFVSSSGSADIPKEPEVERKQADASLTKNSLNANSNRGYRQNIKTSAIGLTDEANTGKSVLLGE